MNVNHSSNKRTYCGFIAFMLLAVLVAAVKSYSGNLSIDISDDATQITGMAGTSNVSVVSGCEEGSGIMKSEKRGVPPFHAVSLDGAFDVSIELQKAQGLEVSGDDNIIPYIITEVNGDTLHVTTRKSICSRTGLKINITNENIQSITADGSSDVSISDVKNRALSVSINGAGDFRASGTTGTFAASISGSGSLDARDLKAEAVEVSIEGAGDAVVNASEKLKASIEGAGNISYYGDPKKVTKNISGAGDIEKGDE